jgi:hypothetical protein
MPLRRAPGSLGLVSLEEGAPVRSFAALSGPEPRAPSAALPWESFLPELVRAEPAVGVEEGAVVDGLFGV